MWQQGHWLMWQQGPSLFRVDPGPDDQREETCVRHDQAADITVVVFLHVLTSHWQHVLTLLHTNTRSHARIHTHARTHAHTRTHTQFHTHAHTRTHTVSHTHTHTHVLTPKHFFVGWGGAGNLIVLQIDTMYYNHYHLQTTATTIVINVHAAATVV